MYIDNRHKFEDTKSTAYTFTLVGGLGLIAIVLFDAGVFPIQMQDYMKVIFTIVMGGLFAIFTVIGIKSFLSLKQIQADAEQQDSLDKEVREWFLAHHADTMKCFWSSDMDEEEPDSLYFPRAEKMAELILAEYKNLSADEVDHLTERLYAEIFHDAS